MSAVKTYVAPNRLARYVNTTDGVTLAEALQRAEANLRAIRPPGLDRLDEVLAELGAQPPAQPSPAEVERLYALANELAGTAGVFGLPALGQAAYSLCELLDGLRERPWNAPAVGVHLNGLKLLRGEADGALTPEAAARILAGLEQVVTRLTGAR